MSKYSDFFLVGSVEYQPIGEKLRLKKFGSWLAEEAWQREEQNKKRAQFSLQTIHLARRIASVKGMSEEEAFQVLQDNSAARAEILGEFSEETAALMTAIPSGRDQLEELVTLFFKNRGEVLNGKKWQSTEDWDKDDTCKLPSNLLLLVEQLMVSEDGAIQGDVEEGGDEGNVPKAPF
jgi:hypothetical protein